MAVSINLLTIPLTLPTHQLVNLSTRELVNYQLVTCISMVLSPLTVGCMPATARAGCRKLTCFSCRLPMCLYTAQSLLSSFQ